ncbi:hypothetical protein GCM10020331_069260 [Ectobacillus funiculus]
MAKVYYQDAVQTNVLKRKKTIAIVGYGSQGHAHAQNLRDNGFDVIIGLRQGRSWNIAVQDGFEVKTVAEAAKAAEVIMILLPDELQGDVYNQEIAPNLEAGNALVFAHGFNVHFGEIKPPADVDVFLVAPKRSRTSCTPYVRRRRSSSCIVRCIPRCNWHSTRKKALSYADGIGSTRAGVLETTFKEETETDLFR